LTGTRFARLISMKTRAGEGEKFVMVFRREILPMAEKLHGMRRLYLLRPVGRENEFVVLSLWDDKEAAERYAKSGKKDADSKLLGLLAGRERVRKFHVEAHAVGESAKSGE
jgi:heme-degrading monooxygenase HmoA